MNTDSREKILRAATPLFAEEGYDRVSLRKISEASGVNSAMISYYFGGKKGLFDAAFASQLEALEGFLSLDVEAEDPRTVFRCYAEAAVAVHEESPYLLPYLYRVMLAPDGETPTFAETIGKVYGHLVRALERGMAAGLFREDLDTSATALLFAGSINFHFLSRRFRDGIALRGTRFPDEKTYIAQALAIFLRGIAKEGT